MIEYLVLTLSIMLAVGQVLLGVVITAAGLALIGVALLFRE